MKITNFRRQNTSKVHVSKKIGPNAKLTLVRYLKNKKQKIKTRSLTQKHNVAVKLRYSYKTWLQLQKTNT